MLPRLSDRVGGAGGTGHRSLWGVTVLGGHWLVPQWAKGRALSWVQERWGCHTAPVQAFGCPGWRLSLRPLSSLSTVAPAPLFFPADRTVTTTSEPPAWPTQ